MTQVFKILAKNSKNLNEKTTGKGFKIDQNMMGVEV